MWFDILGVRIINIGLNNIGKWLEGFVKTSICDSIVRKRVLTLVAFTLWNIWKEKNSALFKEDDPSVVTMVGRLNRAVA